MGEGQMTTPSLKSIQSSVVALWQPLRISYPLVTYREFLPSEVAPAVVAKLTGSRLPWVAALVDLARRGVVRPEEEKSSRLGSVSFTLCRPAADNQGLTPYEQLLLEAIFQESNHVPLTAVGPRLAWQAARLDEALINELTAAGWLDPARQQQREQHFALSAKSAVAGVALLIGGLVLGASFTALPGMVLSVAPALCGTASLVLSVAALGLGLAFSALSERGELAAAQWKGFALFLKQAMFDRQSPPKTIDAHLSLAVALGLTNFLKRSQRSLPTWFDALANLRDRRLGSQTSLAERTGGRARRSPGWESKSLRLRNYRGDLC
jgi:hypothetical protein